jgi:hypothetical protein
MMPLHRKHKSHFNTLGIFLSISSTSSNSGKCLCRFVLVNSRKPDICRGKKDLAKVAAFVKNARPAVLK